MTRTEQIADIARRWTENEDATTRAELLMELRAATGAQTELEAIDILLQTVFTEHERADAKTREAERWFTAWRDLSKPANYRGDKRHLLKN